MGSGASAVPSQRSRRYVAPVLVSLAGTLVAVARFSLRHRTSALDESGYLTVARQWHGPGTEVYTNYFLDRPPLLLLLLRLGNAWGGMTGLRMVGLLGAVAAVLVVAAAAGRVAGPVAAAAAALFAAALLASPASGATQVNGELLAAPFTALGLAAGVGAVTTTGRRALAWSAGAGLAGALAVMVKQNMLDVWVFLVAVALLGPPLLGRRAALARLGAGAAGGVVGVVAVLAWADHEGSPPRGVLFAMYGFRWRAAKVLADNPSDSRHASSLLVAFLLSGLALGVVVVVAAAWSARRRRDAADVVLLGLGVTLLFDAASVASGQQYWTHYLVQLVVPMAAAVGLAAARSTARVRWPVTATVAFALVSFVVAAATLAPVTGSVALDHELGRAVRQASRPSDTIVTLPEHGDVTYVTGLRSPYPYLWRLQSDTLDPHLTQLLALLDGRSAPTWVVDFPNLGLDIRERRHLRHTLTARYRPVNTFGKATVYLRQGMDRPALTPR